MHGLMTREEVAAYLRVRPAEVSRLVDEDGLPVIELPGQKRLVRKFSAMALHGWLVKHSKGEPIGLEAFLREIEDCRRRLASDPDETEGRDAA